VRGQLEELLDGVAIGIAQIDTSGRYLLANDRYCDMISRSREQILESQLQDLIHPEDLPAALEGFIHVLETGEPRIIDHRVTRSDGLTLWIGNTVSSAHDSYGKPQHLILLAQDVTRRKEIERALVRSRADLRMMIDSTAEGIYCVDREGSLTLCNAAFLRMLGFAESEDVLGRDIHELVHHSYADGSPYPKANCPVYKTAQSGIHAHLVDELFFRRDGTQLPVECWVRPIVREGEIEGAVCTFFDITERKQAEAQQQLLIREMAHRVKNTLAMVQAITGQSLRNSPATRDVSRSISQRLIALGNAHTVLTRTRWGNASIAEVVESAIAVHRSHAARIQVTGPNIEVGTKAALGIAMVLHELCTNAAKYGALSNDTGTVSIEWVVVGGASDARFRMFWKETDGPPVLAPTHRGFGSRLIAESVGIDLKGEAALVFDPAGVAWRLDAPLSAVRE
jgi:PAS domain S-box-containing protein